MIKPARRVLQLSLEGFEQPEALTPVVAASRGAVGVGAAKVSGREPNADLVGRTFFDGTSEVLVKGLAATNPAHVVVERERDGHTWTIHAGVVRMIVGRTRRKRAA